MVKYKGRKHYIDTVAALLIFTIFAICIIVSILLGAKMYKGITMRDSSSYEMRTCTQYLANKVRGAYAPGSVSVIETHDGTALKIDEIDDGENYCTYIYCYDGWLRELFLSGDKQFSPESGEKLIEMNSLDFSYDKGIIKAELASRDNVCQEFILNVRGAEVIR